MDPGQWQKLIGDFGELRGQMIARLDASREDLAEIKGELAHQRKATHDANNAIQAVASLPRVVEDHELRLRKVEEKTGGLAFRMTLVWGGIASLFALVGAELIHLLMSGVSIFGASGKP